MLVVPTRHTPLPNRFGVIFIDCWEFDWTWQGDPGFYQGMKKYISTMPIDFKVFHTTYLRADLMGLETINYLKAFVENHPNKIRGIKDFLDNAGNHRLASDLWEIVDNRSMLIPSLGTFSDLIEILDLKHWIVMGAHWNLCVHDKSLGLHNIKNLRKKYPDIEFYVHLDCIARWKWSTAEQVAVSISWQDLHENHLKWSRQGSDLARLEICDDLVRKPKITIFTNWPGDIIQTDPWQISRIDSSQFLIDNIMPSISLGRLEHLVHMDINEKGYADEYALYVIAPGQINLAKLLYSSDHEHAVFIDNDGRFILVRQHATWISKFL